MKNVLWFVIAVSMLGLTAFSGCAKKKTAETAPSGEGGKIVRWAYWGAETRVKRSQEAIDLYRTLNPEVLVNPEVS
ncbi:MAG: sugar ABC transporter substrate-binding protein, partial [Treponema sp.]|nr:sugar ABC transporter substrate-binding protein [Treponema sp.]